MTPARKMRSSLSPAKAHALKRVEPGSFLTLHYRLRDGDGVAFVDTFATPPATLSLGTGELAPAMEARLLGLAEGSEESFALAAGEAFGERDPALVHRVSRAALDAEGDADGDYRVGDVVRFPGARRPVDRRRRAAPSRTTRSSSTSTTRSPAAP